MKEVKYKIVHGKTKTVIMVGAMGSLCEYCKKECKVDHKNCSVVQCNNFVQNAELPKS